MNFRNTIMLTVNLLLLTAIPCFCEKNKESQWLTFEEVEIKELTTQFKESVFDKDEQKLLLLIHPQRGLRFSYLGENEVQLTKEDCSILYSGDIIREWGEEMLGDGSVIKIRTSFKDKWLPIIRNIALSYDKVGFNEFVHQGNAVNKRLEHTYLIDVTSLQSEKSAWWESLRLFYQRIGDKWYLVEIDIYHAVP